MSDFIVQFGDHCTSSKLKNQLKNKPWMADRQIYIENYLWGQVILQCPADPYYAPYKAAGQLVACIGRPRFLKPSRGGLGFNHQLSEFWCEVTDRDFFDDLTGVFALLKASTDQLLVARDHMGSQPVYRAHNSLGQLVAIGTDVELLALAAGNECDFDPVSLGELLVYNSISFPYSSRNGIEEFNPGVVIEVVPDKGAINVTEHSYWQPTEPAQLQEGLADDLVDRMRAAGADIANSCDKIAVTLSGGLDSRAVLSVLPNHQVTALTYVTHSNFETDIAREVSRAYGCEHVFAKRSEDYFERVLLSLGPELLGTERRAMLHGLCILESDLHKQFDVILGGQLSDTYLKDHYMPKWQRESLRPKGPKERLGVILRKMLTIPEPVHLPGIGSNMGRYLLEQYLSAEIRGLVCARRNKRLEQVRLVRPTTAEEWVKFWPTSRQDDLSHILGNSKLFSFESLFSHKYIIDFATQLLPEQRYCGAVASKAFAILYANLAHIPDANTGRPPGTYGTKKSVRKRRRPSENATMAVWNNVSDSWFDMVALQKFSPQWQVKRQELANSAALAKLDSIIDRSATELINTYSDDLGPTFNQMFMQLATVMDQRLNR